MSGTILHEKCPICGSELIVSLIPIERNKLQHAVCTNSKCNYRASAKTPIKLQRIVELCENKNHTQKEKK